MSGGISKLSNLITTAGARRTRGRQAIRIASGANASGTQDDAVASAFGVEPAGRRRWTRARSKSPATGPRPDDFNPSSRGDERGEVM